MATPLVVRMIAAAQTFPALQALGVGFSSYPFPQGSVFPWITLQVISDGPTYVFNARLSTSWTRVQALIFGTGVDPSNAQADSRGVAGFSRRDSIQRNRGAIDRLNNIAQGAVEMGIVQTQPMTFQIRHGRDDFQQFNPCKGDFLKWQALHLSGRQLQ